MEWNKSDVNVGNFVARLWSELAWRSTWNEIIPLSETFTMKLALVVNQIDLYVKHISAATVFVIYCQVGVHQFCAVTWLRRLCLYLCEIFLQFLCLLELCYVYPVSRHRLKHSPHLVVCVCFFRCKNDS